MSYNIILNSSNVVIGSNNSQYKYNFINGFTIPPNSEISINQITLPYSFYNITQLLGNNTFSYTMPTSGSTSVTRSIILSDGFYTLTDINNVLYQDLDSQNYFYYSTTVPVSTGISIPNKIYPITFSTNTKNYCNSITFNWIANSASMVSTLYGSSYVWALGVYPTSVTLPTVTITGTVNSTSYLFGNIVGFINGTYPNAIPITISNANASLPGYSNPVVINGNSLKINTITSLSVNLTGTVSAIPFPSLATNINGIIVRCNLVENDISSTSDILDSFPITSTFGSNLNYIPISNNACKLKPGKFQNLVISFYDQNLNSINILDSNVLISLVIKFN